MGVQELRLKGDPVRLPPEGSHLLERFAPIETALKERIPGILVPPERVADHPDDGFPVSHGGPPYVASLARLPRRSQAAMVSICTAGSHLPHPFPRCHMAAVINLFVFPIRGPGSGLAETLFLPAGPECPTNSTWKFSSSHLQKENSVTVTTMLTGAQAARIPTATSRNRTQGLTIPFPSPTPSSVATVRRNDKADSPLTLSSDPLRGARERFC